MAALAIIGTDVHRLPLDELERIAAAGRDPVAVARRARESLGGAECAALVTCNRVELIVAPGRTAHGERPLEPVRLRDAFFRGLGLEERGPPLHVHHGESALRHLLRVACSLESAALGEEQILGQVRDAIRGAREAQVAGARLTAAFDLALRVGKRVRRETGLAELGTDLARLALRHVRPELRSGRKPELRAQDGMPLVLLGTGAMARALLLARPKDAREGWLVVGRDESRASALAREFGCDSAELSGFLGSAAPFRALLAATRSERPVIGARLLRERLAPGAGVVDLGLPRNVDPEARAHARLADLADLHALADSNRSRLDATIERIGGWIEEAVARQRRKAAYVHGGTS